MKLHVIEFEIGMIRDRTEAECYLPCITIPLQDMDYSAQSDFTLLIILLTLISHFDFLKSKFLDLKNIPCMYGLQIWITAISEQIKKLLKIVICISRCN